jgi:hypothetical protein
MVSRHRRDVSSLTVVDEGDVTRDEEEISNTFLHVTNETDEEEAMGSFDSSDSAECCASTDEAGSCSSADSEIFSSANEVEESRADKDDSNEIESEKDDVGDAQGAAECRARTEDEDATSNTTLEDENASTHDRCAGKKETESSTDVDDTKEAFCESEKVDEGHDAPDVQGELECSASTEDNDATSDTNPLDEGAASNPSIADGNEAVGESEKE